jgi:hypothetical protein
MPLLRRGPRNATASGEPYCIASSEWWDERKNEKHLNDFERF